MKKLIYLIVAIAVLGLLVSGCLPVVPPTNQSNTGNLTKGNILNVPSPYTTIQAAIDAASSGDTIIVGPGIYNEAITVNKSLTIQSSGTAANTIINASNTQGPMPPYMYAVTITANDVTFQGFTVKYNWLYSMKLCGIKLDGASGCTVSDNVGDVGNEAGIYLDNSDNNTISGNDFSNNAVDNGIYLYYSDGNEIVGNDVSSLSGHHPKGIQMNMADNNLIHGHTINSDRYAIWIYQGCSGNKIYENELSSNTRAGIYCEWSAGSGNEIYDNTISGNPVGILWLGSNNEIYENDITGNTDKGIWLFAGKGNTIHFNNIVGNVNYGVYNSVSGEIVDAKNNWWGAISGPTHTIKNPTGTGDAVSDNVKFCPWALDNTFITFITLTLSPPDPQPVDSTFYLVATLNNSTSGVSIDVTINGNPYSPGSTDVNGIAEINVGPLGVGVYNVSAFVKSMPECLHAEALLAVYDPTDGFVTGGGWIDSPAGAYRDDITLSGKANFGFVSKYKKGQSTPTGNTEFQFKAGNLNFHSDSYDWLVIAGPKAMYKGTGTINSAGNYGFMLSAIDEKLTPSTDVDMFRIKIWDKVTDSLIYDNQFGDDDNVELTTEIGGGQIVIHKK